MGEMVFNTLFSFKRLLVEVRRIANALEVIALHYARLDNRMWNPRKGAIKVAGPKEEPELLHTVDEDILFRQYQDMQKFMGDGYGEEDN